MLCYLSIYFSAIAYALKNGDQLNLSPELCIKAISYPHFFRNSLNLLTIY
jgi:hypothetical protein